MKRTLKNIAGENKGSAAGSFEHQIKKILKVDYPRGKATRNSFD